MTVKPVKQLRPLQLLERGSLTRITGQAFVAGRLPLRVSYCLTHRTRDLTLVTNICKAAPISLFWVPMDSKNYWNCISNFLLT